MRGVLTLTPRFERVRWTAPGRWHRLHFEFHALLRAAGPSAVLPAAGPVGQLPSEVCEALATSTPCPENRDEQALVSRDPGKEGKQLGDSGTMLALHDCERTSLSSAGLLAREDEQYLACVFRRALVEEGCRLVINNRRLEPWDPTFRSDRGWPARLVWLETTPVRRFHRQKRAVRIDGCPAWRGALRRSPNELPVHA